MCFVHCFVLVYRGMVLFPICRFFRESMTAIAGSYVDTFGVPHMRMGVRNSHLCTLFWDQIHALVSSSVLRTPYLYLYCWRLPRTCLEPHQTRVSLSALSLQQRHQDSLKNDSLH